MAAISPPFLEDEHTMLDGNVFNPVSSGYVQIEDMTKVFMRQMDELRHLQRRQEQLKQYMFEKQMDELRHLQRRQEQLKQYMFEKNLHRARQQPSMDDRESAFGRQQQVGLIGEAWEEHLRNSDRLFDSQHSDLSGVNQQYLEEARHHWLATPTTSLPRAPVLMGQPGHMRKHYPAALEAHSAITSPQIHKLPEDRLGNTGATTLMVRNIPVRYTQEMLLKEWPNKGTYDFLYLPICIKKKCNASFAFINFLTSEAARGFAEKWHHERLLFFSSRKPLDISLADLQGLEKNLLQCMNNKTSRIRNVRFQPAVFKGNDRVSVDEVLQEMRQKVVQSHEDSCTTDGAFAPGMWHF